MPPNDTKITTMAPLRSKNLDTLMKWKNVEDVKIVPYAYVGRPNTLMPLDNVKVKKKHKIICVRDV